MPITIPSPAPITVGNNVYPTPTSIFNAPIMPVGAVGNYYFILVGGAMPKGMRLNPLTGAIQSGTTTTEVGVFRYSYVCIDSTADVSNVVEQVITINSVQPPAFVIGANPNFFANQGSSVNVEIEIAPNWDYVNDNILIYTTESPQLPIQRLYDMGVFSAFQNIKYKWYFYGTCEQAIPLNNSYTIRALDKYSGLEATKDLAVEITPLVEGGWKGNITEIRDDSYDIVVEKVLGGATTYFDIVAINK